MQWLEGTANEQKIVFTMVYEIVEIEKLNPAVVVVDIA